MKGKRVNNTILIIAVAVLVAAALFLFFGRPTGAAAQAGPGGSIDADKLLETRDKPFILVDVRSGQEYASGHIPGALNIPHDRIGAEPPTPDKQALIVLYCRSGARSSAAEKTLKELGYSNLVNYGGLGRWKKSLATGAKPE